MSQALHQVAIIFIFSISPSNEYSGLISFRTGLISLLSKGLYDLNYRLKALSPKTVTWGLGVRLQHFVCLVAQLCPSLYPRMDSSLPGSSVHGDSPGKNTGVGCHVPLQGIFPTEGSNTGLPHCW